MENEFDQVMAQRTDEELINILNGPEGDYQPEAMDAAKRVFDKRKISNERVSVFKREIKQKKQEADLKAGEPLEWYYKIYAFIIPRAFGSFIPEGYDRKMREWQRSQLYGFFFYSGIVLLLIILMFVFKVKI